MPKTLASFFTSKQVSPESPEVEEKVGVSATGATPEDSDREHTENVMPLAIDTPDDQGLLWM